MKKYLIALALALSATAAYAACVTNTTIDRDGRMTTCQICCYGSSCTTTCF